MCPPSEARVDISRTRLLIKVTLFLVMVVVNDVANLAPATVDGTVMSVEWLTHSEGVKGNTVDVFSNRKIIQLQNHIIPFTPSACLP